MTPSHRENQEVAEQTKPSKARRALDDEIVRRAYEWVGTPYHHQASMKHCGADCLGLLRGLYFELYGEVSEKPPPYSRDWAELGGQEPMLQAAMRYLEPIPIHQFSRGGVLLFRFRANMAAKHAAIFIGNQAMIHGVEHRGVIKAPLSPWWRRHIAGVFRFPLNP